MRTRGIPCAQYIDDRHLGKFRTRSRESIQPPEAQRRNVNAPFDGGFQLALRALHIAVSILTSLGYFLSVSISVCLSCPRAGFLRLTLRLPNIRFFTSPRQSAEIYQPQGECIRTAVSATGISSKAHRKMYFVQSCGARSQTFH
jgi:hypothetical protein